MTERANHQWINTAFIQSIGRLHRCTLCLDTSIEDGRQSSGRTYATAAANCLELARTFDLRMYCMHARVLPVRTTARGCLGSEIQSPQNSWQTSRFLAAWFRFARTATAALCRRSLQIDRWRVLKFFVADSCWNRCEISGYLPFMSVILRPTLKLMSQLQYW